MAATSYSTDPTLYLYTSLTAGSSHIITATSRLETILKANKIPFRALDCATDEKARMLWGRRSKGRKLPGLVKYGEIIGDLEQIEEWNEYGELKEQISATQDFGSLTASTNLAPQVPQVPATSTSSTPSRSGPPSRASSETRHISIAEPPEKEKEKATAAGEAKPASSQKSAENPMNVAIRQLGAEAAAKATQKKAATAQPPKAAAIPVKGQSTTDQVPTAAADRVGTEAAVESPDTAAEVTAAKTPAQLASEGAARTSVDKIAESEDKLAAGAAEDPSPSKEEQILEMRRTSSVTKSKSRLSDVTPIEESDKVVAEPEETSTASQSSIAVPEKEVSSSSSTSLPSQAAPPRQHRGSDIGEATPEEIRALEKELSIPEENDDEDDDDDGEDAVEIAQSKATEVTSTDKAENEATKGTEPQKTEPKDADKAGVSVGD
ncbi:hypothetical protein, variant [Cladophialophora immunda]|uniref:Glutaredoxin domain-containing protein n=1 Tax=Cladophialophora immunda TaxID=569365 RepID=A0A0D1ZDD9_9EURO|nr:uncharacterized protein PV07_08924 [Cladophialophora immunda]XP_016245987.1 hypothetical protein, variant [Cladophialophora immunda]KIW25770.1 hypothetical protein PV07_08924 [Cladophialophora immunda]KIW25771.1 hypothetical protein, variant [Cladophialophora immunda]